MVPVMFPRTLQRTAQGWEHRPLSVKRNSVIEGRAGFKPPRLAAVGGLKSLPSVGVRAIEVLPGNGQVVDPALGAHVPVHTLKASGPAIPG
jgi:hypothetical protein